VDRDDVGFLEEGVELAVLAELGLDRPALRVEHPQLEALRSPTYGAPDAAESEDAEGRAGHLLGHPALRPGAAPATRADVPVALDDLPARGEDQREREIGGGVVEDAGRVRDDDTACRTSGDVDPVEPHAEVRDDS
jgi:hypothetical protein